MRETQPVDLNEREKELLETAHSLLPISAARLPAPPRARFLHRSFYRGRLIRTEQTRSWVASDGGGEVPRLPGACAKFADRECRRALGASLKTHKWPRQNRWWNTW